MWNLPGWAAFWQTSAEVAMRPPGKRMLDAPISNKEEAKKDWQFAWLAEASYRDTSVKDVQQPDPDDVLKSNGWEQWQDFPDKHLEKRIRDSHLRVEVWEHRQTQCIVVTFGGTVFDNCKDWRSNLRWFIPFKNDEYTQIVKNVGPGFLEAIKKKSSAPNSGYLEKMTLYSTGHSLGGGLAQQFAYALPENDVFRVSKVYAFDPSPVTGFFSVGRKLRNKNIKGLSIDRIYERGEILAIVRSFTSFFVAPSATNPCIRGIRYNLFRSLNPISGHSIHELACRLSVAAGVRVI